MPVHDELIATWHQKLFALFNGQIPNSAEWTQLPQIVSVLNSVAGPFNHFFLPEGGGLDLCGCQASDQGFLEWTPEKDCLSSHVYVNKPVKLTFGNNGRTTRDAYFILEVDSLGAVGPDIGSDYHTEEVVEISRGEYADRYAWDAGEYRGESLPSSARLMIRTLAPGRFALFGKGSVYNQMRGKGFDAYSGHHNDPAHFNRIIEQIHQITD